MKYFLTVILFLFLSVDLLSQEKTIEIRTTINTETGDTIKTESVVLSETEDVTPRNHMISINPLKFLIFYNITYYTKISEQVITGVGVQTPTIGGLDGIGVNAELRFYPSGKNMRGFYFAPNISYNYIHSGDIEIQPFSFGALVGWQWFPSDQFAMGLGIGIDYYSGNVSDDDDFDSYNGSVPALRFDIGYAW